MDIKKRHLKKVENVEGNYHMAFVEGQNRIKDAKTFLITSICYLLIFTAVVAGLMIFSGLNFYLIGFELVFIVIFIAMMCVGTIEKNKGIKECIYAVNKSNEWAVIFHRAKNKKVNKSTVRAMSRNIDKYDRRKDERTLRQKMKRKARNRSIARTANEFDRTVKSSMYGELFAEK